MCGIKTGMITNEGIERLASSGLSHGTAWIIFLCDSAVSTWPSRLRDQQSLVCDVTAGARRSPGDGCGHYATLRQPIAHTPCSYTLVFVFFSSGRRMDTSGTSSWIPSYHQTSPRFPPIANFLFFYCFFFSFFLGGWFDKLIQTQHIMLLKTKKKERKSYIALLFILSRGFVFSFVCLFFLCLFEFLSLLIFIFTFRLCAVVLIFLIYMSLRSYRLSSSNSWSSPTICCLGYYSANFLCMCFLPKLFS